MTHFFISAGREFVALNEPVEVVGWVLLSSGVADQIDPVILVHHAWPRDENGCRRKKRQQRNRINIWSYGTFPEIWLCDDTRQSQTRSHHSPIFSHVSTDNRSQKKKPCMMADDWLSTEAWEKRALRRLLRLWLNVDESLRDDSQTITSPFVIGCRWKRERR